MRELTEQQQAIYAAALEGCTAREIADRIERTPAQVSDQVRLIRKKGYEVTLARGKRRKGTRPHVKVTWDGFAYVVSNEEGRIGAVDLDHPAGNMDDLLEMVGEAMLGNIQIGSLLARTEAWENQ